MQHKRVQVFGWMVAKIFQVAAYDSSNAFAQGRLTGGGSGTAFAQCLNGVHELQYPGATIFVESFLLKRVQ